MSPAEIRFRFDAPRGWQAAFAGSREPADTQVFRFDTPFEVPPQFEGLADLEISGPKNCEEADVHMIQETRIDDRRIFGGMTYAFRKPPTEPAPRRPRFTLELFGTSTAEIEARRLENSDLALDIDPSLGLGISFEYLISRRTGLELSFASSDTEIGIVPGGGGPSLGEASGDFQYLSLGWKFHFFGLRPADVFLGPLVARIDFRAPSSSSLDLDFDAGFGAMGGARLPAGSAGWFWSASARYLEISVDVTDRGSDIGEADLDIFSLHAGFGYRF